MTETKVSRVETFSLPWGEYYIGCPELAMKDTGHWQNVFSKYKHGLFEHDGHKFLMIRTGADGYWHLYETPDEDGTTTNPETGEVVEGSIKIDSLPTDVASMAIMPYELLRSLGCDMTHVEDSGHWFEVEGLDDGGFGVDFNYKMYEGRSKETLSYVEFLWFKLNIWCQYLEDES